MFFPVLIVTFNLNLSLSIFSAVIYSMYGVEDSRHVNLRAAVAQHLIHLDQSLSDENKEFLKNVINSGLPDGQSIDENFNKSISEYARNITLQPGQFSGPGEAIAMANLEQRPFIILRKEEENSVRIIAHMPDLSIQGVHT